MNKKLYDKIGNHVTEKSAKLFTKNRNWWDNQWSNFNRPNYIINELENIRKKGLEFNSSDDFKLKISIED